MLLGTGEVFDLDSYVNSGAAAYYRAYSSDNEGKYYNQHTNYFEALEEIGSIIINDGFTKMYVETY